MIKNVSATISMLVKQGIEAVFDDKSKVVAERYVSLKIPEDKGVKHLETRREYYCSSDENEFSICARDFTQEIIDKVDSLLTQGATKVYVIIGSVQVPAQSYAHCPHDVVYALWDEYTHELSIRARLSLFPIYSEEKI